ncbi:hypothetical protein [Chromobacterium subtsugae]|uniref:hypothetical protein n=1 Tax=Chromobacterium subtsugae TaxID=251747 RepID=UPI000641691B|nr:hypothetical protein [Chromobacterium subtsugae]
MMGRVSSRWCELFSLTVEHPYSASGRMVDCMLRPDAASQVLMRRFGLMLRAGSGRFELSGDEAQLAGLWSERAEWPQEGLMFDLLSRDPKAAYYTDMSLLAACGCFRPGEDGTLAADTAGQDASNNTDFILARLILPPLFAAHAPETSSRFRLVLPERRTLWKYLLVGGWREGLQVVDARGEVRFAGPWREMLPHGGEMWSFRSLQPIGLRERPAQRFQLREGGAEGRVLVDRLPLASPQGLIRENVDGAWLDVSEIFVNR